VAPSSTRPYHHGDLRNALVDAAVAVARAGGPGAVVVRDVARQVGVSHNAGYRHFASRDELLRAVGERGLAELVRAMEAALALVPGSLDPQERARQRLRAVGRGYVSYALAEPGMFRTIWPGLPGQGTELEGVQGEGGLDAYELLCAVLDELVEVGLLDPCRRPHAEIVAWSAVHGLAALLIDGPLRALPPEEVEAVVERLYDVVEHGVA
jgi:AcrR family transcriptional regulator